MANKLNILLLSSAPGSHSSKRIAEQAEKRGHTVRTIHPDDFYLFLSEKNGNDRIYLKTAEQRLYSKEFDRVIVRIGGSMYGRHVVRHISMNMHKFCTSRSAGIEICSDKFRTAQILSTNRIQTIGQILTREASEQDANYLLKLIGGIPFVFKVLTGSQGVGIGIIDSELSAGTTLESISNFAKSVLLQRFINTKDTGDRSSDIRIFIVDGRVEASMKRYSKAKQFRSNFSISSMGEKYSPTSEQKELALDAAAACKCLGICGVDLMVDQNGNNYVVEVNSNPGLKIEEVTKINVVDKIIDYTERGKLSDDSINRYTKFDISAKVIGKGFYASGRNITTKRRNGASCRLYIVQNIDSGDEVFYDFECDTFYKEGINGTYIRINP